MRKIDISKLQLQIEANQEKIKLAGNKLGAKLETAQKKYNECKEKLTKYENEISKIKADIEAYNKSMSNETAPQVVTTPDLKEEKVLEAQTEVKE